MENNIKDYINLYVGQKAYDTFNDCEVEITNSNINMYGNDIDQLKPILRPLSDMTEEEIEYIAIELKAGKWNAPDLKHMPDIAFTQNHLKPEIFLYLLKQGFDLFGLIESGLAINKTTYGE